MRIEVNWVENNQCRSKAFRSLEDAMCFVITVEKSGISDVGEEVDAWHTSNDGNTTYGLYWMERGKIRYHELG